MNCPECGHPADKHGLPGYICEDCQGKTNKCRLGYREVLLQAWRAEALAARDVIALQHEPTYGEYHDVFCAYCKTHWHADPKHTDTCPYGVAMQKYLAARVNDEKETP